MDSSISAFSKRQISGAGAPRLQSKTDELFGLSLLTTDQACESLGSSLVGLSADEAERRLKVHGLNLTTREQKPTILQEIWNRTKNLSTH